MGTLSSTVLVVLATTTVGDPVEGPAVTDTVDLVEVNYYFDPSGQPNFQQLIFYDWCPLTRRYQVRDFHVLKGVHELPYLQRQTRQYVMFWLDDKENVLRRTYAGAMRLSWTQYDPERLENDRRLPKERRIKLSKPPSPSVLRR